MRIAAQYFLLLTLSCSSGIRPGTRFDRLTSVRWIGDVTPVTEDFSVEDFETIRGLYLEKRVSEYPICVHYWFCNYARERGDAELHLATLQVIRELMEAEHGVFKGDDWSSSFKHVLDGARNELSTEAEQKPFFDFIMSLDFEANWHFMQGFLAVAVEVHNGELFDTILRKGTALGIGVEKLPPELIESEKDFLASRAQECSVCSEKMTDDALTVTCCNQGHKFHPACLREWLEQRRNCPICREDCPPSFEEMQTLYRTMHFSNSIRNRFDFFFERLIEDADEAMLYGLLVGGFVSCWDTERAERAVAVFSESFPRRYLGMPFTRMIGGVIQHSLMNIPKEQVEEEATRVVNLFMGKGTDVNHNHGVALLAAVFHKFDFLVQLLESHGGSVSDPFYYDKICDSERTRDYIFSKTGRTVQPCVIRFNGVPRLFNDLSI